MQKTLLLFGVVCIIAAVAWPYLGRLPLGRLPGDIVVDRPGFKFYFPVTTGLIISAILTLLGYLFKK